MKKSCVLVAVLLICMAVLSGCGMVVDIGTVIKNNGSGTVTASLLLDEELYEVFTAGDTSESATKNDLQPITYQGETYYGVQYVQSFSSLDELKTILTHGFNMTGDDSSGSVDSVFLSLSLSQTEMRGIVNKDFYNLDADEYEGLLNLKKVLTFTFPNTISATNGSLSADKKTVTWTIDDTSSEIYVKTENSGLLSIIMICSALVIVLGGVFCVIVIIKKKKRKMLAAEAAAQPIAAETVLQNCAAEAEPQSSGQGGIREGIIYCSACGTAQPVENVFCSNCGAALKK